ncbi:MAG TPA: glycosyltransferase [Trueperaceae bacterium]
MRILAWPAFANREHQPYNALLYSRLQQLGAEVVEFSPERLLAEPYDIFHLHWPDSYVNSRNPAKAARKTLRLLGWLRTARSRGASIVWTVHNLRSHGRSQPLLEPLFWRAFTRQLDGLIYLSASGKQAAEAAFPVVREAASFIIPHGHYRDVYPNRISRAQARHKLGIDENAKVLGFVGRVRAYKNVLHLIRTFHGLMQSDLVLLIAGQAQTRRLHAKITTAARADRRVKLALCLIPESDMQTYLNASDLVVLPYREVLNSGTALLALSFDRRVLVPAQGAMGDLQAYAGEDWVRTYRGQLEEATLTDGLAWALSRKPATLDLADLAWDHIAQQTLRAYQQLRACRETPPGRQQ